jgi:hypothetical protein
VTRAVRRAGLLAAAAALVAVAALLLPRQDCLVVRTNSGRVAALFPLEGEEPAFVISWRHSVTREPCAEYFRKGEGGAIELYRTVFKGLGAGLPFGDEGGAVSLRDGAIVIDGMKRSFARIDLIALPLTEHHVTVGGREYDLLGLLGGEHRAVFTIEGLHPGRVLLVRAGRR